MGIVTNPSMRKSIHGTSYISKNYIDWFEQHGIRIVPIPYDTPNPDMYFSMINGLCLPDNIKGINIFHPLYIKTITRLFDLSIQKNEYFPIWGECYGYHLLLYITGHIKQLKRYNITGYYPIHLTEAQTESCMIQFFTSNYLSYLEKTASTYHNHLFGISPEDFMQNIRLQQFYHIVATTFDDKGREFVALIEAKKYPIYGLAFHPSGMKNDVPFIKFLIAELRKNKHKCPITPYLHNTMKSHPYLVNPKRKRDYYLF